MEPRSRPALVPRCAYGGQRFNKRSESPSVVGAVVESNVSAEHLATKRSSWFRANADRSAAGRLGKPLWKSAANSTSTSLGSSMHDQNRSASRLGSMSPIRRPFSAMSRKTAAGSDHRQFACDRSTMDRFESVSRPSSAVPRVASAARRRPNSAAAGRADSPNAADSSPTPAPSRPGSAKPHTGFPAFAEAPRPQSIRERMRAARDAAEASRQLKESQAPSKLRSIVQMRREAAVAVNANEVAELSNWQPRPSEAKLFSGAVVGRYRTAVNSRTSHTMWDLALEPPIVRDRRVRAEMAKLFEDQKDAAATAAAHESTGNNPTLRQWDDV